MAKRAPYQVDLYRDVYEVAPLLRLLSDGQNTGLVFQDPQWIIPWYESFRHKATPLIAVVTDSTAGGTDAERVAMVLPLVRRRRYWLPLVEFADCGVTDYNLPIDGPRAPRSVADARSAMGALEKALRPFALLRLTKMPRELSGRHNPLDFLEASCISEDVGHYLPLPEDGVGFLRSFGKKKRVEIERASRNLEALGPNRFAVAASRTERLRVFALIKQAQRTRLVRKGERYYHEEPGYKEFYEALVGSPANGITVVSAIWLNEEPVAGLLGVRDQDRFVALRIGLREEPEIMRLGLGKVLLMRTAEWAIEQKLNVFDFSLGATSLKAWFHPEPFELIEYSSLMNGHVPGRFARRKQMTRQPLAGTQKLTAARPSSQ